MAELSESDAVDLNDLAKIGAWWTHDVKVRDLYDRGVSIQAMAKARGVPEGIIAEVLKDDSE
jgi:hypothetical protein